MSEVAGPIDEAAEAGPQPRGGRGRRIAVVVIVLLAAISTFVSSVAVWAHQVVLDTDKWVETVGPLAQDEAVTDALAAYLVEELITVINVQQLATDALPDEADFLAAPLTSAVEGFVTDQVEKLLETEEFATFWVEANRVAHEQAVRLLRGEPGVVTINEGEVTLNLLPFMARILTEIDKFGLLPDRFSVPDPPVTRDMPVDEANQALSDALGVDLKPDFGQIVVYQSDQLAAAQDAVATFEDLVAAVVILTVVLYGAAIILSTNRRRTILQLVAALVGALIVAAAVVNAAMNHVLGLITDEADRSAAASTVRIVLESLRDIERLIAFVALVIAAIAFFTGDSSWARRTRRFVREVTRREPSPADEEPVMPAVSWLDEHRDALKIGGLVIGFAALLIVDLTFGSLLAIAVALGVYEAVLAILPRHIPAEVPPSDEPAPDLVSASIASDKPPTSPPTA